MAWLWERWTKEGPGVPKDAPRKTGLALFWETLTREWLEIVKLNILFLLAALFIVTIPAALVAMARVSLSLVEDRNTYLLQDFTQALVRYFWRATAWGGALTLALGVGGYAITAYAASANENLVFVVPLTIALLASLFILVMACHLVMLMVMRDLAPLALLRLAALASILRPLPALASLLFVATLWIAHILLYPVSVFMPAAFNFSLGMFAVAFGVHRAAAMVLALPPARPLHGYLHAREATHI
ncbi:MAG: DUF624 domain-containing protein [Pseudorhizobium sp.]